MTAKIDALIHLPVVDAGPWKHCRDGYNRRVVFKCEHGNYRHAILTVYANDEGAAMIFIRLDGVVHELSVGECADLFSTANEMLVAFSHDCNCRTNTNGDVP